MFHMQLAEYSFTIDNHFKYIEELCKDYMCDKPGKIISVNEVDIDNEQTGEGCWPAYYLESLAVYRKICEYLLFQDMLLFHCSALVFEQNAYLFTAPSGTGKSTHTRLWREYFGERVKMVNDDKPLLQVNKQGITVFGTPFAGKEGLQTNMSAPVKGIVVLHQSKENEIRKLTRQEAYPLLLSQTYRTSNPTGLLRTLELVESLAELPVYSLGCTISFEAVQIAHDSLVNDQ